MGSAEMIREFNCEGETFRVNAHGVPGHGEVFVIHLVDGEEMDEISIDSMTEENDTRAPIEAICEMLCDRLIIEQEIDCAERRLRLGRRQPRASRPAEQHRRGRALIKDFASRSRRFRR
jgi:hypothetical protein